MIKTVKLINDNNEIIKNIPFEKGLNVILADVTSSENKKSDKNSRNGAGKTSLIEIIDFCMGGSIKTLNSSLIENWTYCIELEIYNETYEIYRCVNDNKKIYFFTGNFDKWEIKPIKIKPDSISNTIYNYYLKEDDWKDFLGKYLFSLDNTASDKYYPKYRSIISYFIRYYEDAFLDPFKYFKNQKAWQSQVYNAFLLNLNWEYAITMQNLKDKKDIITKLKNATKNGYFKSYTGTLGELESEKVVLQNKVAKYDTELAEFKVHPHYEDIQKEANQLTEKIHNLSETLTVQKSLLEKYEADTLEEKDSDISTIKLIYKEAGLMFPNNVSKSLEEIVAFHSTVIQNRKDYLNDEIKRLNEEIQKNDHYLNVFLDKRAEKMKILKTHNAIDEFNKLQNRNAELKAQLSEMEKHIENIKKMEADLTENKKQILELLSKAKQDLNEREEQRTLAIKTFAEIADFLYAEKDKIGLSIDFDDSGYKYNAFIGKDKSTGRTAMKVFDYDMTIMKIRNQNNNLPGFLIHDSDVFDSVDERQIAKALEYADESAKELGTRYICFMNSDRIPQELFSKEFKNRFNECIRIRLEDTEDGGLFGFRF
ncbi:MAG: DUF2326 domain-containing protein [Candidatus Gastranaerophilales bacterium]|nr:DUF2326 domain-containing protein [Candidatus Gastranaerophilales bacterium]